MPGQNPNHHLWRNGRLWWIAFTVVYDGWRQERIRRSLRTTDLDEARRRRDALLLEFASLPNAEVIALREYATIRSERRHAIVHHEPSLAADAGASA
jgi:hypothetical protein